MYTEYEGFSNHGPIPKISLKGRFSSCEIFGIDAFAEEDLGYAPS